MLGGEGSISIKAINSDPKKRHSFVALLFGFGYGRRYVYM